MKIFALFLFLFVLVTNIFAVSISVSVFSAGFDDPGYYGGVARLYVDGIDYANNTRGVNLIVIHEITGVVTNSVSFDTHGVSSAADAMASFINSIPVGRIVLAATKDEAVSLMTTTGINSLYTIGATSFNPGYRGSWALIGTKGGTGIQTTAARYVGPVSLSSTIHLVPEPSTYLFLALGMLGIVFYKKRNLYERKR